MPFSIGDITKLNVSLQGIVFGLILLMPIFFLDIFIFFNSFYKANPLFLVIILSYCLSIGWLLCCILIACGWLYFIIKDKVANTDTVMTWTSIFAVLIVVIFNANIYLENSKHTFRSFLIHLCIFGAI